MKHPFDVTQDKLEELAKNILASPEKLADIEDTDNVDHLEIDSHFDVFATGDFNGVELSRGISCVLTKLRGVQQLRVNVRSLPGIQLEARIKGASSSRQVADPEDRFATNSGIISLSGIRDSVDWIVDIPRQSDLETIVIHFPIQFIRELEGMEPEFSQHGMKIIEQRQKLYFKMDKICLEHVLAISQLSKQQKWSRLAIEAHILQLLNLMFKKTLGHDNSDPPVEGKMTDIIKQFVQENLDQNLSISSLASHFRMSESHLKRVFHLNTGQSLGAYVTETRMDMALKFLKARYPISRISSEVGYATPESFSKAFRRYYGNPPRSFLTD